MRRISNYNIGAALPGQPFYVLLHGFTGAVDKVETDLGKILVEQRGLPVTGLLDRFPNLEIPYFEKRGYLTTSSFEEERAALIQIATHLHGADITQTPPGFMFIPTYTCNLRCPYCFQSHEMHAGRGVFSKLLTEEQVDSAFAAMEGLSKPGGLAQTLGLAQATTETTPNNGAPSIGLFGGEPLTERTRKIVFYIATEAQKRGKTLSAVTNGVELAAFDEILKPGWLDQLQITLDGTANLHDRRRVGPGFKQTFGIISNNIDLALRRGVKVGLRMNVDSTNAAELESLSDYCQARGWTDFPKFSAHAAAVTPEAHHQALITKAQVVQRTLELGMRKNAKFFSYEKVAQETLMACLDGEGYPFRSVANCSAESGLLMFDPLGDVHSCWEEIGDRSKRVATYDEAGLRFEFNVAVGWLSRFPGAIEQCSSCPYALIHTSGCAKHARDASGTIFASACESFQEYFPATLALAYDRIEASVMSRPRLARPADIRGLMESPPRTAVLPPVEVETLHA